MSRMLVLALTAFFMAGLMAPLVRADARERIGMKLAPIFADPPVTGLVIFEVLPGSQADEAGLRVGDILTHYAGRPVESTADLSRIAREVIGEQQAGQKVLVLTRRDGGEPIASEFDPAPLGVRLAPLTKGEPRTLWRPETRFTPDAKSLERQKSEPHRWELLTHQDRAIGARHHYVTERDGQWVLRIQSRVVVPTGDEKKDVVVYFVPDRYLSPRAVRLAIQDRVVLDFTFEAGTLKGERVGIGVEASLPADTVSSYLAGLVASTMPREAGACLRCSALEDHSLVAAPFADLYCAGPAQLDGPAGADVVFRYEFAVFGDTYAQYWIDREGRLVQEADDSGVVARAASEREVRKLIPGFDEGFEPIEHLPSRPAPPVQAN